MDFGSAWLQSGTHLAPDETSAMLPAQKKLVINSRYPAWPGIKVIEEEDFLYDPRMLQKQP
ncbi:hypothetical protein TUM18999_03200 [Pseudomonas tohonis]|uniref:Uncharacterized protein n=1 Tax=Pseudomonas tohonis TaxID=2725477 RepID=A0A6J4DYI2_9PSED|nr:hypothetical protein TUM18999_03200 [Pseudomonas tohonis]